jgi:hypothetical protein
VDLPHQPALAVADDQYLIPNKFHYLAQGAKTFAFVSEDGSVVLKLFKKAHWFHPWRLAFRKHIMGKPDKDLLRLGYAHQLEAAKLAFDKAADLTGLVYIHLNPTRCLINNTELVALTGHKMIIDLNRYGFAIQKRADSIESVLSKASKGNDLSKLKRLSLSFESLIRARSSRGIKNQDIKVVENFGFIGDQAIEIDFGHYVVDESPEMPSQEHSAFMEKFTDLIKMYHLDWINESNVI